MPAPLEIIVTNAGRAAIINAQNTGTAPVTITQIGLSATALTPLPTTAVLLGEIKRVAAIAGEVVADDTIHVTLTDESADAYSLRSLALYLADGTLFAIYGQAGPVLEKTPQSIAALAIDVIFADIAAAALTFGDATFTNPPATTERQGIVELATVAEAQAGIDALRALTPSGAKAAVLGWLLSQDGSGSGLDADLLDGVDGSTYARRDQANTFTGDITTAVSARPIVVRIPAAGSAGVSYQLGGKAGFDVLVNSSGNMLFNRSDITTGNFVATSLTLGSDGSISFGGTVTRQGFSVWDAGNDGSGSGMDADLLDGQHGSYYADIVTRLGYTPWGPSNDGSGSGLDADLLDGVDGASYARRDQANTFTGDIATAVSARPIVVRIPAAGSAGVSYQLGGKAGFDILVNSSGDLFFNRSNIATGAFVATSLTLGSNGSVSVGGALNRQGNTVWDAGNDGSGSGLDADLLDGLQATAFALMSDFGNSLSGNGYQRLPNGLILQWGNVVAPSGGINNLTFPIAFPNACLAGFATNQSSAVPSAWAGAGNLSLTGMTVGHASSSLTASAAGTAAFWFAIGR